MRNESAMRKTGWRGRGLAPVVCAMLLAGGASAVTPALPNIPAKEFTVASYGTGEAMAADLAPAFQKAIDAASAAGGGTVVVPKGEYLCGPVELRSRIRVRLEDGVVIKLLPLGRFPIERHRTPFLGGKRLEDVALVGRGRIDGQGAPWWPHYKEKDFPRPVLFGVSYSKRILVEDVAFVNSPMFHIACTGVEDVTIRGVTVEAPPSHAKKAGDPVSHNTDACDVSGRRILIERCRFSTGDDNYTTSGYTEDVLIRHCRFGTGHGLSMGSYQRGFIRNFTVEDCSFDGTDTGIRIKCDRDRGGDTRGIVYRNIEMRNVGIPILIYGAYNAPEPYRKLWRADAAALAAYPFAPATEKTPRYCDIMIENLTAVATDEKSRAGLVWGLPEAHVKGLKLKNVKISSNRPLAFVNVDDPRLENVEIKNEKGEILPLETAFSQPEAPK